MELYYLLQGSHTMCVVIQRNLKTDCSKVNRNLRNTEATTKITKQMAIDKPTKEIK